MAKGIRYSSVSTGSWDTDWFECCLFQGDTIESLISYTDGYQMLEKYAIKQWSKCVAYSNVYSTFRWQYRYSDWQQKTRLYGEDGWSPVQK